MLLVGGKTREMGPGTPTRNVYENFHNKIASNGERQRRGGNKIRLWEMGEGSGVGLNPLYAPHTRNQNGRNEDPWPLLESRSTRKMDGAQKRGSGSELPLGLVNYCRQRRGLSKIYHRGNRQSGL